MRLTHGRIEVPSVAVHIVQRHDICADAYDGILVPPIR